MPESNTFPQTVVAASDQTNYTDEFGPGFIGPEGSWLSEFIVCLCSNTFVCVCVCVCVLINAFHVQNCADDCWDVMEIFAPLSVTSASYAYFLSWWQTELGE